ncbi:MAG: phosphotransferase, partial [Dehalococcoidia bacterium]
MCDLHIPAEEGGEPALEQGLAVYACAADVQPGTPSILLTGSGDQRAARELAAARPAADIFGVGEPYAMTDLIFKHEARDYTERIAEVARQIVALNAIEVDMGGADIPMSQSQARALRIFARRHQARRIEVVNLGGLSASLAVRATLLREDGGFIAAVFAKLAALDEVASERERYQEAALRLPAGSYAPLLDTVMAGAGRTGGLFYGLAERHQTTLFEHLAQDPAGATAIAAHLREVLGAWRDIERDTAREPEHVLVTTLRRDRAPSGDLAEHTAALVEGWQDFERRSVPVRRSLQHGDLHGSNVLIGEGEGAIPLLIDFSNVEEAPSCFDPVVLELSLVFHPDRPPTEGWPTIEQCEHWDDIDAYVRGCPAPDFVRACREWALEEGAAPVSVYAVAYAEALRQLRYAEDESDRALAIAAAAARAGLALVEPAPAG